MSTRSARRKRKAARQKRIQASASDAPLSFQASVAFSEESLNAAPEVNAIPSFTINAYNGGKMRPRGFSHDVVFDLAGSQPKQVPVFLDHETSGKGLVGQAEPSADGTSLNAVGMVSADTESARIVVNSAKRGFQWQSSIGANIDSKKFIPAGSSAQVNGQLHKGPFLHLKGQLHEISFVPIGADSTTSAQIAARSDLMADVDTDTQVDDVVNQVKAFEENKEFRDWVEAKGFVPDQLSQESVDTLLIAFKVDQEQLQTQSVSAQKLQFRKEMAEEAERVEKIKKITARNKPLQIKAIAEGMSVNDTELALLKEQLTIAPVNVSSTRTDASMNQNTIECAMMMQADPEMDLSWLDKKSDHWKSYRSPYRGYDEQTIDAATDLGEFSFSRLFHHYLHANNVSCAPGTNMDGLIEKVKETHYTLRASTGFSTIDISGILSNVMGKSMLAMFENQNNAAQRVSSSRSVSDFKETKAFRLTGNGEFLPIGPTGELQLAQLQEEEYPNRAATYGRRISVSRTMLINDDLGALTGVTRILGRKAAVKLQKEFFTLWLNLETGGFFAAGNKNLITGPQALDITGLTAAEKLFNDQVDADGDPIDNEAATLLVSTGNKVAAEELMQGTTTILWTGGGDAGASSKTPDVNPHVGKWSIVSTQYLNNQGITGGNDVDWYLVANPSIVSPAEIVYLNGRQTPFIQGEDNAFEVLGFQWRSYFDFGIAQQDFRGAVKVKGA